MATKLYLRVAAAANPPTTGEKSSVLPVGTFKGNSGATYESLSLNPTKGSSQTTKTIASLGQSTHQDCYICRFTSAALAAQNIAANTWTIACCFGQSNAAANAFLALSVYIWRPSNSSVVGFIYDSDTALGAEWSNASTGEYGQVITFSGAAVNSIQAGDVLVVEVWDTSTQGSTVSRTLTVYFDGTTDTTAGQTTDSASYLSTPQNLAWFDLNTLTFDAVLKKTFLASLTANAYLKFVRLGSFGADATLAGAPPVPQLIQHSTFGGTFSAQIPANGFYHINLLNPAKGGNCLVVGVSWDTGNSPTVTVEDDNGNTWTPGPSALDTTNGQGTKIFYALNVAAGTQVVRVKFTTATAYVSAVASEFSNIATASAADGSNSAYNPSTGSSVAAGNITTTADGDLIYQYATNNGSVGRYYTPAGGFTLLSSDPVVGQGVQFEIQSSKGTINPTMTQSSSAGWGTAAIALKAASSGGGFSGIHADRVTHFNTQDETGGTRTIRFPSAGNLLVLMYSGSYPRAVTGITDSNGNQWAQVGGNVGSTDATLSIWYAKQAVTSGDLVLTVSMSGSSGGFGETYMTYDVSGAHMNPLDTAYGTSGLASNTGDDTTSGSNPVQMISGATPSKANSLAFFANGVWYDVCTGLSSPSGSVFVSAWTGISTTTDEDNAWGIYYNGASLAAQTWSVLHNQRDNVGVHLWAAAAASFKPASTDFSADAVLKKNLASTKTLDAVLKKNLSGTFAADVVLRKNFGGTFSADAFLTTGAPGYAAVSWTELEVPVAAGGGTVTGSFTGDAILRKNMRSQALVDAVLRKAVLASETADAILKKVGVSSASADAVLRKTLAAAFSSDAVLKKNFALTFFANATLRRSVSSSFLADAVLKKVMQGSASVDAVLQQLTGKSGSFLADAVLRRVGLASAMTADAVLRRAVSAQFGADAILRRSLSGSFSGNSVLLKTLVQTLVGDAVLKKVQSASATADAYLQTLAGRTGSFAGDAVLRKLGITNQFLADAVLRRVKVASVTADARLLKTFLFAVSGDAVLRKNLQGSALADAWLQLQVSGKTGSFTANAILKRTGVAASLLADAILRKTGTTSTVALDAVLLRAGVAGSFLANAMLQRAGVTRQFLADALLRRVGKTFGLSADALLRKYGLFGNFSADALLAIFAVRVQMLRADAVLVKTRQRAQVVPGGNLWRNRSAVGFPHPQGDDRFFKY